MSDTCNWLRRKAKSSEENEKDFYQTPYHLSFALLDDLTDSHGSDIHILDPCCGEKAIGNVLCQRFDNILEFDLFDPDCPVDFLEFQPDVKFDVVVMNPPFTQKLKFIDKALKVANEVYCLFPGLALNYNITGEYKNKSEYCGQISCYPKANLSSELDPTGYVNWGGTSIYTWLYFSNDGISPIKWEKIVDVRVKYDDAVKQFCMSNKLPIMMVK